MNRHLDRLWIGLAILLMGSGIVILGVLLVLMVAKAGPIVIGAIAAAFVAAYLIGIVAVRVLRW